MSIVFAGWALSVLAGRAVAPDRPAVSFYGCMRAVRDALLPGLTDKRAHCLAAGGIAQRYSTFEADLAGIQRAKHGAVAQALPACCAAAGY